MGKYLPDYVPAGQARPPSVFEEDEQGSRYGLPMYKPQTPAPQSKGSIFDPDSDPFTDYLGSLWTNSAGAREAALKESEPVRIPAGAALNLIGGGSSHLIAGGTKAYGRALAENMQQELPSDTPLERTLGLPPGTTAGLYQAPGLGQVGMEALMPGPQTGYRAPVKALAGIAGDIASDPTNWSPKGLAKGFAGLGKHGPALYKAVRGAFGATPAAAIYGPEVVSGVASSLEQSAAARKEHGPFSEEALAPMIQGTGMAVLGAAMGKGAHSEIKAAVGDVRMNRAHKAALEENQRNAAAKGEAPPPTPVVTAMEEVQRKQALVLQQQRAMQPFDMEPVEQVQGEVMGEGPQWRLRHPQLQPPGIEAPPIEGTVVRPGLPGGPDGQGLLGPGSDGAPPGLPPGPPPPQLPPGPGNAGLLLAPREDRLLGPGEPPVPIEGPPAPLSPPPAEPAPGGRFFHLSQTPGIEQLDPAIAREQTQGYSEEGGREDRIPRVNVYREGTVPERRLSGLPERYEGEFPPGARIYDLATDPEGFIAQGLRGTPLEQAVRDAGYHGIEQGGTVAFGKTLSVDPVPRPAGLVEAPRVPPVVEAPALGDAGGQVPRQLTRAEYEGEIPAGALRLPWAPKGDFQERTIARVRSMFDQAKQKGLPVTQAGRGVEQFETKYAKYFAYTDREGKTTGAAHVSHDGTIEDLASLQIGSPAAGRLIVAMRNAGVKIRVPEMLSKDSRRLVAGALAKAQVPLDVVRDWVQRGLDSVPINEVLSRGTAPPRQRSPRGIEPGTAGADAAPAGGVRPGVGPPGGRDVGEPLPAARSPFGERDPRGAGEHPGPALAARGGPPGSEAGQASRDAAGEGIPEGRPQEAAEAPGVREPVSEGVAPTRRRRSVRDTAQARGAAALERLRARGGGAVANMGADPKILADLIDYGASRAVVHGMDFKAWSVDMVKQFGEAIRPRLRAIWDESTARLGKTYRENFDFLRREGDRVVGAPDTVKDKKSFKQLFTNTRRMAKKGEVGRFWYEDSSKAILDVAQGNKDTAEKLVQLIAIYSPNNPVPANWTDALQAYHAWKGMDPTQRAAATEKVRRGQAVIEAGRFGARDRAAEKLLFLGQDWRGAKTNNFYRNLMTVIDPEDKGHPMNLGTTIDLHMMRALGYNRLAPSTQQYIWADNFFAKLGKDMGWEPWQVQAAAWTTQKGVRDAKGRLVKEDFSDVARKNYAQVSWEATPHQTTNQLPGIHRASYDERARYTEDVNKALFNEDGIDELAEAAGLLRGGDFAVSGFYEGEHNPGIQVEIQAVHGQGAGTSAKVPRIDAANEGMIKRYAAALGKVLNQQAVAYHRPFFGGKISEANGLEFPIGRMVTQEELGRVYQNLPFDVRDSVALVPTRTGLRLLNFSPLPNKNFHKEGLLALQRGFPDTVEGVAVPFQSLGDLISNDWKESPNGEGYARVYAEEGGPDLSGAVDRAAGRVREVNARYAEEYGWGQAEGVGKRGGLDAEAEGRPDAGGVRRPDLGPDRVPEEVGAAPPARTGPGGAPERLSADREPGGEEGGGDRGGEPRGEEAGAERVAPESGPESPIKGLPEVTPADLTPTGFERLYQDAVARQEARAAKLGKGTAFFAGDPRAMGDAAIIGAHWLLDAGSSFAGHIKIPAEFTARMVKDFGEGVTAHLDEIWEKAHALWENIVTPNPKRWSSPLATELSTNPKIQTKGLARDYANILSRTHAEEMKWTGLDDWLKERAGQEGGRVTKAEIDEFVKANQIEIEETRLGEELEDSEDPQYAQYTEPGGKNYRELLLKLPEPPAGAAERAEKIAALKRAQAALPKHGDRSQAQWNVLQRDIDELKTSRSGGFKGAHFARHANVLAHIRFNERTGPAGERVLFIEEIQSDWAQKGRKQGFTDPAENAKLQAEWEANMAELKEKYGPGVFMDMSRFGGSMVLLPEEGGARDAFLQRKMDDAGYDIDVTPEMVADTARYADITARTYQAHNVTLTPRAPFLSSTEAWTGLAMKRMLRYAAENGFDRVAWTTGEMQSARYDLSKQVDEIKVSKRGAAGYDVTGTKDGSTVLSKEAPDEAALEALIGKDLAKKAVAETTKGFEYEVVKDADDQWTVVVGGERYYSRSTEAEARKSGDDFVRRSSGNAVFSGVDLKVGGEGMKGYYDTILPSVTEKFGSKFGVKVEKGDVGLKATPTDKVSDIKEALRQVVHDMNESDATKKFGVGDILDTIRVEFAGENPHAALDNLKDRWEENGDWTATEQVESHKNFREAKRLIDEIMEGRGERSFPPPLQEVPSISIPYEMRRSLLETGAPLFGKSFADRLSVEAEAAMGRLGRAASPGVFGGTYLADSALVGADLIVKGARKFSDFSAQLVKALGQGVSGAARKIYEAAVNLLFKRHSREQAQRPVASMRGAERLPPEAAGSAASRAGAAPAARSQAEAGRAAVPPPTAEPPAGSPAPPLQGPRQAKPIKEPGPYTPRRPAGVPDLPENRVRAAGEAAADTTAARVEGKPSPDRAEDPEADINVGKISADETVEQFVARLVNSEPGYFGKEKKGARGETRTWESVRQKAIELGLNEAQVRKAFRAKGGFLSDVELESAKIAQLDLADQAQKQWETVERLRSEGKLADVEDAQTLYDATIAKLASLTYAMIGAKSEAARTLNMARKLGERLTLEERFYQKWFKDTRLDDQTRQQLFEALRRKDFAAVNKLQQKAFGATWMQKVVEGWKAGLLSGPPTQMVNFLSTGVKTSAIDPGEAFVMGLIDKVRGVSDAERRAFAGEGKAMMRGGWAALDAAWNDPQNGLWPALKQIYSGTFEDAELRRQASSGEGGAFEHSPKIGGQLGVRYRIPFQLLQAADNFWKTIGGSQELYRQAYREARQKGFNGVALEAHLKSFVEGYAIGDHPRQDELRARIKNARERGTFQAPMGPIGRAVTQVTNAHPYFDVVLPFKKTPINIAKDTWARTPMGFAEAFYKHKKGKLSDEAYLERKAQALVGSTIAASIYLAAMSEGGLDFTGGGPADPQELQNLKDTGWQPYSIKVGDRYLSYQRLEPLSAIIGFAADAKEIHDLDKLSEQLEKVAGSIGENLTNKTFLSGLTGFANALHDPKRAGKDWIKQLEGSLVPAIVGRAAAAIDPTVRVSDALETVHGIFPEPVAARIPFLSKSLPARQTPVGAERERGATAFERFFSPFPLSQDRSGPLADVQREFARLEHVPGPPPKTRMLPGGKKITLDDREYAIVQSTYMDAAKKMARMLKSSYYRRLEDDEKMEVIDKLYRDARARSRMKLYQDPGFRKRAAQVKREARREARV